MNEKSNNNNPALIRAMLLINDALVASVGANKEMIKLNEKIAKANTKLTWTLILVSAAHAIAAIVSVGILISK